MLWMGKSTISTGSFSIANRNTLPEAISFGVEKHVLSFWWWSSSIHMNNIRTPYFLDFDQSHMLHGAGIFTYIWAELLGKCW